MNIIEKERILNVKNNYDVIVCGGGIAGIAAAIAAARNGAKTLLLEKSFLLGGLATSGLITIYLPLCDGCGHQVSFGIAEELFRLSISMGAEADYPFNWLDGECNEKRTIKDKRFFARYNPNIFAILAEQLLIKDGVEILYGTYAVAVDKTDDKINAVIIENKSGRQAIAVKSVVDATGDCDIAYFSGVPTATFEKGNSLAAWYYFLDKNGYNLRQLGCVDVADEENRVIKAELLSNRFFGGLDGKEISDQVILSHTSILNDIIKKRKTDASTIPTMLAAIPQLRMTRKIIGEYILHDDELHKYFEDSIGMVSDWRKRGPIYEVPFRTLYSSKIKNLIIAGRSTSVTDEMWDIMRVIPCCAVTGQAAGAAAAMTDDFRNINIHELQEKLKNNGVRLHVKDFAI